MTFHTTAQLYLLSLKNPRKANELMHQRFSINTLLGRFFPAGQIETFRRLQYETGLVIGGSAALGYLDGRHFDGSDMDLYVEHRFRFPVIYWISSLGYVYTPHHSRPTQTLEDAIGSVEHVTMPDDEYRTRADGAYKSAASILTFYHPQIDETVQLVTTNWNPLELIMNYHSSKS